MVANSNWIEFVCSLLTRIVKSEPFSIKHVFKFRPALGGRKFAGVSYYEALHTILFRK